MIKYVEIENAGGKRGYVFKADFEPKSRGQWFT